MLLALRDFIKHHRRVSTEQLTREFRISLEALEPMLMIWVQKGVVRQMSHAEGCATTCRSCRPRQVVYYECCTEPRTSS